MKIPSLAALGVLLLAAEAAGVGCPAEEASGPIYLAERTQLTWCWEPVTGGVGAIFYEVESQTNGGAWAFEGETDLPEWTLERAIGDAVEIRYRACDDLGCGELSPTGRSVLVYPDFDADGSGVVTIRDLNLALPGLSAQSLAWFRNVFNRSIDGDRYY